MHPQEAYKQRTGTGRLTSLSLDNSEIIIDCTFDENKRTQELINDENYFPMVLYPGDDAIYAETFEFSGNIRNKTLLIFLIDATWHLARKMIKRSPSLMKLPKLSFSNEYRSQFQIKKQPADYCLSTIESSYYLIRELQKSGVCPEDLNPDGLLKVFEKLVDFQKKCEEKYSQMGEASRGVREPINVVN